MDKGDIIKSKLKINVSYKIQNGKMNFLIGNSIHSDTAGSSLIGSIQEYLKKNGWLYYGLIRIFKPVWRSSKASRKLNESLCQYRPGKTILNIGCGPKILKKRNDIINIDIYNFKEVDMMADAADMPFENDSVDFIINQAMLEHVKNPDSVVREMHRLLKQGGEAFCFLPFIAPYHAAPHDFQRWTMAGVGILFKDFKKIEIGIGAGPTSGMLWVVQEWMAILLSFGSKWLHDIIFLVLMVFTAPIKILDIILNRHPYADRIAGGFYIKAKK